MRRRFILCLGLIAGSAVLLAQAQPQSRPKRLAWLGRGSGPDEPATRELIDLVVAALRAKGWVLGENYVIEFRFIGYDASRYPALADELIAWQPDVLYGLETAARAFVARTKTIPVVMATSIDPVGAGLVKSLARPGTNVTGMSGLTDQLVAKQVELLAEIVPGARRIGLLVDPQWPSEPRTQELAAAAARTKGLALTVAPASDAEGVRAAFARFEKEGVGGVVESPTPTWLRLGREVHIEVLRLRLPVVGWLESGAVLSYSADYKDTVRQSADFIDAIFRGANPADLPVRQATRFLLSVDLALARTIGLKLPQAVLVRADKVIE